MPDRSRRMRSLSIIGILALCMVVSAAIFMTIGARGSWSFILSFRGTKLVTMILVGFSIAVSTVLFQTVAGNRILTPSIMGFDALYEFIQTVLVFFLGAASASAFDPRLRFVGEIAVMVLLSVLLYRWLFSGALRSLHLLMLVGIVFGILFRSLSGFMQRLVDPTEFLVLQDRLFASFNRADGELLLAAAMAVTAVSMLGWRRIRVFDVLALGREMAIDLGIEHRRMVTAILIGTAILVSVSTALVGPVTFLGLLVANLAYMLVNSHDHRLILPAAVLIAITTLVVGQTVLEHFLGFGGALRIVIEFLGGIFFLFLLLRGLVR